MSSPLALSRTRSSVASVGSALSISPHSLHTYVLPLLILFGIVLSSAAQTEVAHHLTADIGYNQPYFTFYLTHITFALVFPVHLALLALVRPTPISSYLDGLRHVIADQLDEPDGTPWRAIAHRWGFKVFWLTLLVSVPALAWFVAMVYSPAMDITAIYATSSFHAYFFSMLLLKQPLSRTTVGSIALAFAGVIVLSLAGSEVDDGGGASNRFLGDVVMMGGAVVLGLYEVVYKMALPEGHGGIPAVPVHATDRRTSSTPLLNGSTNRPASPSPFTDEDPSQLAHPFPHPHKEPHPHVPAALHANFLTSCIGVATALFLWIPIVVLDWTGIEPFRWPGSRGESMLGIWAGLEVVAWGGALYNAGLMVLIGIWGPTTSSVANLLTIGLVAVIDAVLLGHLPNLQTLIGVGMICVGFGVLLWEGEG
ncbi:hypothetical protein EHS25_007830 [Saitozyma podzolica]|uniref:EamA domain-containing protein n=1 Tax=Saitozyma podzolica TaxID=1890683 RepID=A0A427YQT3_9TREE|nr:hypothetical protein EHS25_007830 [Saitozyma podzolica]